MWIWIFCLAIWCFVLVRNSMEAAQGKSQADWFSIILTDISVVVAIVYILIMRAS